MRGELLGSLETRRDLVHGDGYEQDNDGVGIMIRD